MILIYFLSYLLFRIVVASESTSFEKLVTDTICLEGASYWSLKVEEYFENVLGFNNWIFVFYSSFVTHINFWFSIFLYISIHLWTLYSLSVSFVCLGIETITFILMQFLDLKRKIERPKIYKIWLFFAKKMTLNVIWATELDLTSRTKLLANLNRVVFELKKKKFVTNSSEVSSWANSYRVESNLDRFDSTRLISSPRSRP